MMMQIRGYPKVHNLNLVIVLLLFFLKLFSNQCFFVNFNADSLYNFLFFIYLFFLSDIVLFLCEREHVEGGMIFQLLEDLTEMSTMRNCKDIFGYIESKQDILGKVITFSLINLFI